MALLPAESLSVARPAYSSVHQLRLLPWPSPAHAVARPRLEARPHQVDNQAYVVQLAEGQRHVAAPDPRQELLHREARHLDVGRVAVVLHQPHLHPPLRLQREPRQPHVRLVQRRGVAVGVIPPLAARHGDTPVHPRRRLGVRVAVEAHAAKEPSAARPRIVGLHENDHGARRELYRAAQVRRKAHVLRRHVPLPETALVEPVQHGPGPARAVAVLGLAPRCRVEEADAPSLAQLRPRDGDDGDAGRQQARPALAEVMEVTGGARGGEGGAGGGDEGGVAGIDVHGGGVVRAQQPIVQQLVEGAFICCVFSAIDDGEEIKHDCLEIFMKRVGS
eukprot:CAMPEP_0172160212 /NCGR_PEP_ID=MMETSP1050-20130122/5433_1 /TAXON_ID=233186 /ORGANISM="Cryptomonas curvata, Strain CCAP979/52" /LENGTH=332 /DNA_ID=CAMNT_0012829951 /DNA_START=567 /DNA_END=1565 /DNA_ORIENTATION=-